MVFVALPTAPTEPDQLQSVVYVAKQPLSADPDTEPNVCLHPLKAVRDSSPQNKLVSSNL